MDAERFDQIARSLTRGGTRRTALRFFTSLALPGGLVAGETEDTAEAAKRRKRGKREKQAGHKRHLSAEKKRKKHHKKKKCKPHSHTTTCAGTCGRVKNTCKKTVDCGSCACDPPCDPCFRCDAATRTCQRDPAQQGDDCGEPGQVCQANGSCACDATSCAPCAACQGDGRCSVPCGGSGCCISGACEPGAIDTACGTDGNACVSCSGLNTCGGGGAPGVCGCTPLSACPVPLECGEIDDGCGGTVDCGECTPPNTCGGGTPPQANVCGCTPTTCAAEGKSCGALDDGCGSTLNCGTCMIPGQQCCDGVCQACCDSSTCPSCHSCSGGACVPVANQTLCAINLSTTSICCNGVCCDGCCGSDGACGPCRVFVTDDPPLTANLGGLTGADAICQARADAAPTPLPGTYKAWLSTIAGESPASGRFRQSGRPYVLVNGTPIASNWPDLISGTLAAPISITESGRDLGPNDFFVWTYTRPDGTAGGAFTDCAGWTSTTRNLSGSFGNGASAEATWTDTSEFFTCEFGSWLYCFQQT